MSAEGESVWLTSSAPSGSDPLLAHVSRPRKWANPVHGGATLDEWHATLTFDRSWWVSAKFGDRYAFEVVREKYRTRAEAVARAEALIAMADRGEVPESGYPPIVWRRWGPGDVTSPPNIRQTRVSSTALGAVVENS